MIAAATQQTQPVKTGRYRWTICALVFFATTINYLDRQVISLLKPTLEKVFSWSESDYSNIVVAFQAMYALGLISVGRIIDKVGTKIGYALTLVFWSLASMLHAAATGTVSFMIYRGFLGVTEAGNFPAAVKTVAEWFPQKERAYATGIFNSGASVGAIVAPVVVPWLVLHYNWRVAFLVTGVVGFIWLLFWFWLYQTPAKHLKLSKTEYDYIHSDVSDAVTTTDSAPKISWSKLLRYRQTWAFIAGKFLTDGIWWFLLFWLPAFLKAQYGLEGMQVSLPIAVVYTMAGVASIFGGWLPMWFIAKRGWPVVRARKTAMLLFALFPLLVIFAQTAGRYNLWYAIVIIGIAASAHQAWSANIYTTVSDMFPKRLVASLIGLGGMAGALGGMLVAKCAGLLFDYYKALGHLQTGYAIMFLISGVAYLLAWFVMFRVLIPRMPRMVL